MRSSCLTALALCVAAAAAAPAHASVTYTATTGNIPSTSDAVNVSATFTLSGSTLDIVLANNGTTSGGNGSVLTGILFNTDVSGVTSLYPMATASTLWSGGSSFSTSTNINGSYEAKHTVTVGSKTFNYGVSTTPAGSAFANSFTLGSNQDDYGILGSHTCTIPISCSTNANKTPFAVGSVDFQLSNFVGSSITAVEFLFTSDGTNVVGSASTPITLSQAVPEPATALVLAPAVLGLLRLRRRAAAQ